MSVTADIADLLRWVGETLAPERAPRRALALRDGEPTLLVREGGAYVARRPARRGDSAPLLLDESVAVAAAIAPSSAAARLGPTAARLEAQALSPFAAAETLTAARPSGAPWDGSAPHIALAAPRAGLKAAETALRAAGARPRGAFAMIDGAPLRLGRRRGGGALIAAGALMLVAVAGAHGALTYEIGQRRAAAEGALAAARAALDAADAAAADAAARAEADAAPIRAARAASAALDAAPRAGDMLAALAAAAPDDAHAIRVAIGPEGATADVAAPDVAALAARLSGAPGLGGATLRGGARSDPATGLQRAEIAIARPDP